MAGAIARDGQMSTVLPNMVNYNPSTRNIGFV
jgi:hypothetical protein